MGTIGNGRSPRRKRAVEMGAEAKGKPVGKGPGQYSWKCKGEEAEGRVGQAARLLSPIALGLALGYNNHKAVIIQFMARRCAAGAAPASMADFF